MLHAPCRQQSTVSSTSASSPLRISSSSVVSSTSSRRNAVPHSRPTSHGSNSTNASSNSANSANSANSYSSSYSNGGSSQSNYNNNYNNFGNSYAGNGGSVVSNSSGTSRSNGAYRSSSSQGHATAGNGSPGGMAGSLPPYSTSPPSAPSAMSSRSASAVHAAGQYSNAIAGAGASATHNTINAYNSGTYSRSIPPSSAASTPSSSVASAPAPSRPLSVPFSQSQSPYVPGHAGSALSASSSSTAPTVIRTAGGSGRSAAHPSAQSHDRALRKIMDLEIANTSLLSVNSSLERTVRQQSVVIQKLKRQLTRFFNQSLGEQTLNDITDISSQLSVRSGPACCSGTCWRGLTRPALVSI
ncbi:hypothetical protein BC831DRAFT_299700 [Entophlyctis helioformis]|nr:hypothetical protein BC831DRAFT_299700 [Entophlyctis helioformis]